MRGKLIILSTRALRSYTDEVVRVIGKEAADIEGNLSVSRFADGEMEAEVGTSVRGRDVFLFASAARNDLGISIEEGKTEMYYAVDALRRAQAGRITLFEPYCSPGRSDRLTRRNSVGLWVHFKILMSLGIDHYITFHLHSEKSKTFIDPTICDVDDVPAQVLLQKFLCDQYIKNRDRLRDEVAKNWLFCSVDAGGEALAKKFAASFGTQMIISQKQRDYSTPNTVESVNILSSGPVTGKTIWIVDDMVDTGHSVFKLAEELEKLKPAAINIAIVHPVFSVPALERIGELCRRSLVQEILVTDTIPCGPEIKKRLPCLQVVPSVRLTADIIQRLNGELPLSPLLAPFSAFEYLK
jgi:ribose-phosphate pyrophosphokinase